MTLTICHFGKSTTLLHWSPIFLCIHPFWHSTFTEIPIHPVMSTLQTTVLCLKVTNLQIHCTVERHKAHEHVAMPSSKISINTIHLWELSFLHKWQIATYTTITMLINLGIQDTTSRPNHHKVIFNILKDIPSHKTFFCIYKHKSILD